MHKFAVSFILSILLLSLNLVAQNKKSKPIRKKPPFMQSVVLPPEPETWKQFISKDLGIACDFPKEPIEDSILRDEFGIQVKSSTVQSFVNRNFYLIEVRIYPKSFLPNQTDLAEGYGDWLKTYILKNVKIRSERTFVYRKFSAVEFTYQQNPKELIIHRSIVVNQRLFQILLQLDLKSGETAEKALESNKERITKFFDSFMFTEEVAFDSDIG